jgi:hypothetical protein
MPCPDYSADLCNSLVVDVSLWRVNRLSFQLLLIAYRRCLAKSLPRKWVVEHPLQAPPKSSTPLRGQIPCAGADMVQSFALALG